MVSAGPSRLTVWDTNLKSVRSTVPLSLAPTAVTISPDGRTAAVGHNGRITIIDLTTASITRVLDVSADVLSIVLGPNGWVYALPRRDQWSYIRSINIGTGVESPEQFGNGGTFYAGSVGQASADGRSLYVAQNGLSPDHIQKFDLTSGTIKYLYDWTYHGTYSACGNLWVAPDGRRIVTRCGNVFRTSEVRSEDLTYNGKLPTTGLLRSVAFALGRDRVVTLQTTNSFPSSSTPGAIDSTVFIYSYQNLSPVMRATLPSFIVLGRKFSSSGQFVFVNNAGDKWYALIQADPSSGLLNDYAIAFGGLDIGAVHSASLNTTPLAPDMIGTAFVDLDQLPTAVTPTNPAPDFLGGVSAKVVGSDGVERIGRMIYVGPGQVNFVVPRDVPDGPSKLYIDVQPFTRKIADVTIQRVSPGIFSARGDGSGAAAALGLRVTPSGQQLYSFLFQRSPDGSIGTNPIFTSGAGSSTQDQVYLLLFGTGVRYAKSVTATVGGVTVPVTFAAQQETDGLDQINLGPLPASVVRSFGDQTIVVRADSVESNSTVVRVQ